MDAIVILNNYVGSIGTANVNQSRALTHEIGHWFNLQHTWGNTNNPGVACGDDLVGDTPNTKGYTACSTLLGSQICAAGVSENYQNYMDYSYCSVMFTNGQAARMNLAANSSTSGRSNLSTPSNLIATGVNPLAQCPPTALFKSDKQIICFGQTIAYTDLSNIGVPTNWSWTFEGGTPSTSSVQNPTITYNNPGTYSVQLISSNSNGSSAPEIKTGYITVLASPITSALSEGFEGSSIPNSIWVTKNVSASSTDWQQTSSAAASGSKSAFVPESVAPSSTVELFSPTYNFSAMPGIALTFKWAGAERDTTTHSSYDVLSVMFSTNCGASWTPRLLRNIKTSTSGVSGIVNGSFYPTSNQFKQEVVPLSSLVSSTNVLFKFKFTTDVGSSNNFYIDDINLSSTVTSITEKEGDLKNVIIFPNPAIENVTIAFDLLESKSVEINVCDVLGRVVKSIAKQTVPSGLNNLSIPVNNLSKGIYFIKINVDEVISLQKVIID